MCQVLHLGNYIWETKVCTVFLFFVGNFISFFSRIVFKGCISNYLQPFPRNPICIMSRSLPGFQFFYEHLLFPYLKKKLALLLASKTLSPFSDEAFFLPTEKRSEMPSEDTRYFCKNEERRGFFLPEKKKSDTF